MEAAPSEVRFKEFKEAEDSDAVICREVLTVLLPFDLDAVAAIAAVTALCVSIISCSCKYRLSSTRNNDENDIWLVYIVLEPKQQFKQTFPCTYQPLCFLLPSSFHTVGNTSCNEVQVAGHHIL